MVREEVVGAFRLAGMPVVSVDAKARVVLGNFAAGGREWMAKGSPRRVLDHDFPLPWTAAYPDGNPLMPPEVMEGGLAVAVLYGVYDPSDNSAHCVVGIGSDTSGFACNSLVAWWEARGRGLYGGADEILVLADCGGSNRCDGFLYKYELARAVRRMGLASATVLHLPPGTSKYNPVEHRLWGPVSTNWAAKPMRTLEEVAGYVSSTTNSGGLSVSCGVDYTHYLTEAAKREARKAAGLPAGPSPEELFDGVAVVERPLSMNATLARWTYQIVVR